MSWKSYLRLNLLQSFGPSDELTFNDTTTISARVGQTSGRIDAGLVTQRTKHGSVYVTASYLSNLGGGHLRTVTGNLVGRWNW